MTIVEFLTARYDERERAVNAARAPYYVDPYDGRVETPIASWPDTEPRLTSRKGEWLPFYDQADALADIAAKRAIIALHEPYDHEGIGVLCSCCAGGCGANADWPCDTVRALASVYSDHPDSNPDWKP